jgi:NAD(P)-dependent dehydrogenase (short-subunit alcohol dehydrogenase family)
MILVLRKHLDLASIASVADFAERFSREHDSLHLLINNAGVMTPPRQTGSQKESPGSDTNTVMSLGVFSPRPAGWRTVEGDPAQHGVGILTQSPGMARENTADKASTIAWQKGRFKRSTR